MDESMMSPESRGSAPENGKEAQLDALFRAYRVACEPADVSPNFMPELWQKIEVIQNAAFSFRRIAKSFVTAAAALTLILAGIESLPHSQTSPVYSATYVEALAEHIDIDASIDASDINRPELADFSEVI